MTTLLGGTTVSNAVALLQSSSSIKTETSAGDDNDSMFDSNNNLQFGSIQNLQLNKNVLNLIDYGLKPEDSLLSGGKVFIRNLELEGEGYYYEIEVQNNANPEVITQQSLDTQLKLTIDENKSSITDNVKYSNVIITPAPIPNRKLLFHRRCADGILYFYEFVDDGVPYEYIGNPYNQYVCGVDIQTEDGVSVLNLNNEYIPIIINNGLIKVSFDKLAGFIILSRYDYKHKAFVQVSILKLQGNTELSLMSFTDDRVQIKFGKTIWNVWRGRPYVQVEHSENDLLLWNTFNCIWCEVNNQDELGVLIEQSSIYGTFNISGNKNLFSYDPYYLYGNMKTTNFNYYCPPSKTSEVTGKSIISNIERMDKVNTIFSKPSDCKFMRIRFPDPILFEKTDDYNSFTLLIDYVDSNYPIEELELKLNGYGVNRRKTIDGDFDGDCGQVFEEKHTVKIVNGKIRDSFILQQNDQTDKIKYIDFQLTAKSEKHIDLMLGDIMLYVGLDENTPFSSLIAEDYLDNSMVYFGNNFYTKMFNKGQNYGLGIIRPTMDAYHLNKIDKAEMTVLAPYIKGCDSWDTVGNIAVEYMNMNNQIIEVTK